MFSILRFFLFQFSAEKAHYLAMDSLKFLIKIPLFKAFFRFRHNASDKTNIMGISFPNKVGLAAGFDKNANYLDVIKFLGFGHVEIGTVTPLAQDGNPKPRLFRLVKDQGIINRMGFNNDGVDVIVDKLKNKPKNLVIGGNIGKNKATPNEKAINDYQICFEKLYPYVDYFTVNVSSPNTPGLRELQDKKPLLEILNQLIKLRLQFVQDGSPKLPILLKIAPDLNKEQLDDIVSLTLESGIDGLVATNTTIGRENLQTNIQEIESIGAGGLSGKPVFEKSNEVLSYLNAQLDNKVVLIGVGGIFSSEDAKQKFKNGAQLVQVYSGFIYKGPNLIKEIVKG
jgi:dihydroorotate dehydrogenase